MNKQLIQKLLDIGGCNAETEWAKGYDDGVNAAINVVEEYSKQPTLNENQQQVLGWLKIGYCCGDSVFEALERITYVYEDQKTEEALESLTLGQEAQVIQSFVSWALEQEEADD